MNQLFVCQTSLFDALFREGNITTAAPQSTSLVFEICCMTQIWCDGRTTCSRGRNDKEQDRDISTEVTGSVGIVPYDTRTTLRNILFRVVFSMCKIQIQGQNKDPKQPPTHPENVQNK